MIDLYYWPTPNGWKISIFLEEAGVPYNVVPVNIAAGEQFKPEFLKISPNNRMPAIVDSDGPDGKPISVFESGAILVYLGEKTGKFLPKEPRAKVQVLEWLFWQMGGVGPMFGQASHFRRYAPEPIPYAIDRYVNESKRLTRVLDERLADREHVAGEYSIADMAIFAWIWALREAVGLEEFKNVDRWARELRGRPAVERGLNVLKDSQGATAQMTEEVRNNLFGKRQMQGR
jgi:GSH-dependent disulfide-bond oxidoreductase